MLMNMVPVALTGSHQVGVRNFPALHDLYKFWIIVAQIFRHSKLHFIERGEGREVQVLQPRRFGAGVHANLMI